MKTPQGEKQTTFTVKQTKPFVVLLADEEGRHPNVSEDLKWLSGRLEISPESMGDHVPKLKLNLPVFKARLKDGCCNLAAREGWRVYYAVSKKTMTVYYLFLHHKKEIENPNRDYLQQKLAAAFEQGV